MSLAIATPVALLDQPAAAQASSTDCTAETRIAEPTWNFAELQLSQAHEIATGAGVRVAVIDSGVAADNPHLVGAVSPGWDLVGQDEEVTDGRADTHGHGTVVATMLAGRSIEESALIGVAPDAEILPIRVYYAEGESAERDGTAVTPQRLAQALDIAVAADADIAVVALSTYSDDAALRAAVERASAAGLLVVASAGNLSEEESDRQAPRYPAAYPGVLAASGMGPQGMPGYGHTGDHVALSGPGVAVLAGLPSGGDCIVGAQGSATSWGTAQVAGAAALVVERFPEESLDQWIFRLTVSAQRSDPDLRDTEDGWGMVQPLAALEFMDDGNARGPQSPELAGTATPAASQPPLRIEPAADPWAPARSNVLAWVVLAGVLSGAVVIMRSRRRANHEEPTT
ncbi:MAG: S8 family serine peptidase [Beutenbergiaceae bacterium]